MTAIAATLITAGAAVSAEKDEAEVMQSVSQFYKALNIMFKGDAEPMKEV